MQKMNKRKLYDRNHSTAVLSGGDDHDVVKPCGSMVLLSSIEFDTDQINHVENYINKEINSSKRNESSNDLSSSRKRRREGCRTNINDRATSKDRKKRNNALSNISSVFCRKLAAMLLITSCRRKNRSENMKKGKIWGRRQRKNLSKRNKNSNDINEGCEFLPADIDEEIEVQHHQKSCRGEKRKRCSSLICCCAKRRKNMSTIAVTDKNIGNSISLSCSNTNKQSPSAATISTTTYNSINKSLQAESSILSEIPSRATDSKNSRMNDRNRSRSISEEDKIIQKDESSTKGTTTKYKKKTPFLHKNEKIRKRNKMKFLFGNKNVKEAEEEISLLSCDNHLYHQYHRDIKKSSTSRSTSVIEEDDFYYRSTTRSSSSTSVMDTHDFYCRSTNATKTTTTSTSKNLVAMMMQTKKRRRISFRSINKNSDQAIVSNDNDNDNDNDDNKMRSKSREKVESSSSSPHEKSPNGRQIMFVSNDAATAPPSSTNDRIRTTSGGIITATTVIDKKRKEEYEKDFLRMNIRILQGKDSRNTRPPNSDSFVQVWIRCDDVDNVMEENNKLELVGETTYHHCRQRQDTVSKIEKENKKEIENETYNNKNATKKEGENRPIYHGEQSSSLFTFDVKTPPEKTSLIIQIMDYSSRHHTNTNPIAGGDNNNNNNDDGIMMKCSSNIEVSLLDWINEYCTKKGATCSSHWIQMHTNTSSPNSMEGAGKLQIQSSVEMIRVASKTTSTSNTNNKATSAPTFTNPTPSTMIKKRRRRIPVLLNVYDFSGSIAGMNSFAKWMGLGGIFHAGIEINGSEYSFGCEGIFRLSTPKQCMFHKFRESIVLGEFPVPFEDSTAVINLQIRRILKSMMKLSTPWNAQSYDVLYNNCCNFCHEFAIELGFTSGIPSWINAFVQNVLQPLLGDGRSTTNTTPDNRATTLTNNTNNTNNNSMEERSRSSLSSAASTYSSSSSQWLKGKVNDVDDDGNIADDEKEDVPSLLLPPYSLASSSSVRQRRQQQQNESSRRDHNYLHVSQRQ